MSAGLQPVRVEGWVLFAEGPDCWIRDLDLAERAELKNPHKLRELVRAAIEDGALTILLPGENGRGPLVRPENTLVEIGSGATRAVTEYYLNEEAALLIVTRLRTKVAIDLTRAVIRVFVAVRRGDIAVGSDGENHRLARKAQLSLAEVRASLAEHIIPAALRANDFDTARTAMAGLEALHPEQARRQRRPARSKSIPAPSSSSPAPSKPGLTQGALMLRTWRDRNGYSQIDAARELDVAQSAYCAWEHGQKTPRLAWLLKVEAKTGIPLAAFTQAVPPEGGEPAI